MCLTQIYSSKIPKKNPNKPPIHYLDLFLDYNITPQLTVKLHACRPPSMVTSSTGRKPMYGLYWPSLIGSETRNWQFCSPGIGPYDAYNLRGIDQAIGSRLQSVGRLPLGSYGHKHGSLLKDSCFVLGGVFLYVSNQSIIFYEVMTWNMNFIQNEEVKLDETCLETRGHFNAHFQMSLKFLDV